MDFRTDLTLERQEMIKENIDGVVVNKIKNPKCNITVIDIKTDEAATKLNKGKGKYITVETDVISNEMPLDEDIFKAVKESIGALLPTKKGTALVVGVGNNQMTSDSLGPKTAGKIFATRHLSKELQKTIGFNEELRPVASISTGVLGLTGVETSEYIKAVVDKIKPSFVITVDALASRSVNRLGSTFQMSNTGIAPGSGVGNSRARIDEKSLGVPVIAVGVPTVMSALSLTSCIADKGIDSFNKDKISLGENLIVAPKDIDLIVKNASELIALSINSALQVNLTPKELYGLM